jgi:hypothetical protein
MDEDETSRHAELAKLIVTMAQAGERDEERLGLKGYLKLRATHSVPRRSSDTA